MKRLVMVVAAMIFLALAVYGIVHGEAFNSTTADDNRVSVSLFG